MSTPLPAAARTVATAIDAAVAAARAADQVRYQEAATRLAVLDPERLGAVEGAVLKALLEDLHPGGFDGDDIKQVVAGCLRSTAGWLPAVDPDALIVVLAGALGVAEAEDRPESVTQQDVTRHAPLLIADLLTVAGRELAGYLDRAFIEIARAETMELP